MDILLDPRFFIIFPVVLVVMVGGFWLIRRLFGTRLVTGITRRRQPRLGVIEAAAVDDRRRLMLIRRDHVEHLLMIGGPRDIVVEPCIVRAVPVISQRDVPGVRAPGASEQAEHAAKPVPEIAPSWGPERPRSEPRIPEAAARFPETAANVAPPWKSQPGPRPRRAPEPMRAEARASDYPLVEPPRVPLQPETAPAHSTSQPEPAAGLPPVPKPEGAPAETRRASSVTAANLAEMAQRLEAAFRCPMVAEESRGAESAGPQPVERVARSAPPSESAVPPGPSEGTRIESLRPSSEPSPSGAARGEAKPTAPEQKPIPPEATPEPKPASPKNVLEKMASLLGRWTAKD
jgi:flagellar protein FliO/FliZ